MGAGVCQSMMLLMWRHAGFYCRCFDVVMDWFEEEGVILIF